MRALPLRRAGFAATLLTGFVLLGSAVHGLSGVDTTLELAAARPDRPMLVAYDPDRGGCERWRDDDDDRRRV